MSKKIEQILKDLSGNPWVYIMKNTSGNIMYVWKSVNLKSRVNSYFNWKSKLNFAKQNMVSQIADIDTIETKNEIEALVLETNLIKRHRPKYNILMKDDKNLVYIKITDDPIPEVIKTRIRTSSWEYFWPYPSTTNVTNVIEVLKKIFKVRNCHIRFENDEKGMTKIRLKSWIRSIPCMDYYIGLCDAPCKEDVEAVKRYNDNIANLRSFLKWNISWVLQNLEAKMQEKARLLEYEEASKIRDQIKSIKEIQEKQLARDSIPWNNDVIVKIEKYGNIYIWITEIRNWEISSIVSTKIENKLEEDPVSVFEQYLQNKYVWEDVEGIDSINLTIIASEIPKDKILLKYFKENRIKMEAPSIWPKLNILNFTRNNLLNFAYKEELAQISKRTLTRQTQNNILKTLSYKEKKDGDIVFECYDISHLGWTNTVASRSVIVNGKTESSKYKKYKLSTIKEWEIDDFKSMEEILTRRFQEAQKLNNWPDLIIIDWWKGQLSSALKAISPDPSFPIPNICSIAKREEEVFVPSQYLPIIFEKWTPELSLLQKIRDEAHRFAINFNRQKRIKEMKRNILEEIPGFWPKTRQKLLKATWNVDNIANLSKDELAKILNKTQIEKLEEYWII